MNITGVIYNLHMQYLLSTTELCSTASTHAGLRSKGATMSEVRLRERRTE